MKGFFQYIYAFIASIIAIALLGAGIFGIYKAAFLMLF